MPRKSNKPFTDILKEHHKMIKGLEQFELKHELNRIADLDMMLKVEQELKQSMIAILISFRYHYILDVENFNYKQLLFYTNKFIVSHPKYKNELMSIIEIKYDPNNDYRYVYNPNLEGDDRYKLNIKLLNKLSEYELFKFTNMMNDNLFNNLI